METDRKEAFIAAMDKERLRDEIRIHGTFIIQYRLMIDGVPTYVNLKATTLVDSERFMIVGVNNIDAQVRERAAARKASEERDVFARLSALNGNMMVLYFVAAQIIENGRPVLIVGVLDEDAQVRREQEFARNLSLAQRRATRDSLTGVRNKHAYADEERDLDELIESTEDPAFAIVVCDVNDLKRVNDTLGHKAGDQYIRDACAVICDAFKHSPVFRVGGDEFAIICRGYDYDHLDENAAKIEEHNVSGRGAGGIQIAYGVARFEADESAEVVFERADRRMYKRKAQMKTVG